MLNNAVGENLGLLLQWQQQRVRLLQAQQRRTQAAQKTAPLDERTWRCPRCGSRQCVMTNPGNLRHPIYCCVVCGYRFAAPAPAAAAPATDARLLTADV